MDSATLETTPATRRKTPHAGYARSVYPRVLIVDDDPDFCEVMAQLLLHAGFVTVFASNGQDALNKAHAIPPRVIVLDMTMPVMDGWTFLANQRYDTTLGAIPVVILSGAPMEYLLNLGAAAAFQKPFRPAELIATLRAHC
jgi:CheY-like chemotaxis protein